ncbi:MAG: DMT family transporter [Gemmatimonadaceae bacterium]|nr:DMT family transporter [Gemmatimonadaceae bacterium]
MSKRTVAVLSLVLVMTIWGSSFAITKTSLSTIPPVLLALLRFAVASVLLLPIAQLRGGTARLQRPIAWSTITLMGLTGVTLYYIGYNVSLYYISASQAVLLQSAIPAVTAFLAFVFLRERLSAKRVAGIGISLIGVALVMIAAAPAGGASHTLLGNVLMAGTTILWAAYTILAKRLAASDQLVVTAYSTVAGTVMLAPIAVWEVLPKPVPAFSANDWISVLYLGAISTAGGYWLYNRSLQQLQASQTSAFINLMPVVGIATAVIFLGETLVLWQIAGAAFVLIGTWLST